MLNKKVKAILFMFLILFCVAAVNAEAMDNTADMGSVEIINVESSDYVIAIDGEDTQTGNFSALNKTINGKTSEDAAIADDEGTIKLDKDYKYNESTDTPFKNGINITTSKVIDGDGHTIDGNHMARIFNVIKGGTLTIKNIILVNGYATDNGGAIYNNGNLTVINSTFINNTANRSGASYGGGAIYTANALNVTNSSFKNNSAQGYGGAIYSNNGILNVTNSEFSNNSVNGTSVANAGAIYAKGFIIINNSNFTQNTAKTSGGAIYSTKGLNITNSNFNDNKAASGGAIYVTGTSSVDMNVVNSSFVQNSVSNYGAGIYVYNCNLTVINSTFSKNVASSGAAIYGTTRSNLTIINSTFDKNTASNFGGAINAASNVNMIIDNSTFADNTANNYGGAIYSGKILIINNSVFNNNTAKTRAGAIYVYSDGYVNLNNSKFNNNTATNGGAVFVDTKGILNVTNSTFSNNTATNGGVIYGVGCNITVDESKLVNNTATNGGAIYYTNTNIADVSLNVMNSNFDGNHGLGDDIYTSYNTTVMNNNYTKDSFGNIYVDNIIINGTVVSVFGITNNTYYVRSNDGKFRVNATVFVDGASVQGHDLTISDGKNSYETKYVGYGVYEITEDIFADFKIRSYTAIIDNDPDNANYTVKNGTVINNKLNTTIEVELDDVVVGKNITGNITIRDANGNIANFTGNVTVEINNKTYTVEVVEGTGNLNIENELEEGNYTMDVAFEGSSEYNPSTATANFTVEDSGIVLEVHNLTKYYGNDGKLVIMLTDAKGNPIANATVTIVINGVTYTRTTDENGRILMNITLIPGVYEARVFYENLTEIGLVTVLPTIDAADLVKYYLNGTQYYATFYDINGTPLANTEVTFNINGRIYTRTTDENGTVVLNIDLNPGEYIITATNPVNNETFSSNVTVLTTITGEDVVKYFKNGTQYYAIFLDLDGNPLANRNVTFIVHGVTYTRTTDEKGIAQLNITLNPGEYIITAINPANNETYSNTITVLTVVESEDLEMTVSDEKPFKVTILGEQGEPLANAKVTFNIHGIFYHETTDANGQISLNLNLIAGKYIITTYYNGYSISNTITVK